MEDHTEPEAVVHIGIPTYTDNQWLDYVAAMPELDLPSNQSTVAFAVRLAVKYREQARAFEAMLEEYADRDRAMCQVVSGSIEEYLLDAVPRVLLDRERLRNTLNNLLVYCDEIRQKAEDRTEDASITLDVGIASDIRGLILGSGVLA